MVNNAFHQLRCTLAVTGGFSCKVHHYSVKTVYEHFIILVLCRYFLVSCKSRRHYAQCIVCGCITVHAYHIVSYIGCPFQCLMQKLRIYLYIGCDKSKHCSHIGIYHTAALADTADVTGLAVKRKLYRKLLFACIGRHYRLARKRASVLAYAVYKRLDIVLHRVD